MSAAVGALSLDELLASKPTFDDGKTLSYINGYLTAVASGPEAIAPDEWFHQLWGNDPSVFDPEGLKDVLFDILTDRFNDIVDILENDPDAYEPDIVEDPATGEAAVEDWISGFLGGVGLRGRAWSAIIRSEIGQIHFVPIAVFIRDEDGNYIIDQPEADQARAEAGDELAEAVVGMYHFFRRSRHYFEGATRLGRNDPCFCGSGRKFKKCCGADHG